MLWIRGLGRDLNVRVHGWIEEPLQLTTPLDTTPSDQFFEEVRAENREMRGSFIAQGNSDLTLDDFDTLFEVWENMAQGERKDKLGAMLRKNQCYELKLKEREQIAQAMVLAENRGKKIVMEGANTERNGEDHVDPNGSMGINEGTVKGQQAPLKNVQNSEDEEPAPDSGAQEEIHAPGGTAYSNSGLQQTQNLNQQAGSPNEQAGPGDSPKAPNEKAPAAGSMGPISGPINHEVDQVGYFIEDIVNQANAAVHEPQSLLEGEPEEVFSGDEFEEGPDPDEVAMETYATGEYNSDDEYAGMQSDPRDPITDPIDFEIYCLEMEFGIGAGAVQAQTDPQEEKMEIEQGPDAGEDPEDEEGAEEIGDIPGTEESALRRSKRVMDRGGPISYAELKKTKKKRVGQKPPTKKDKTEEENALLAALTDEALKATPLDDSTASKLRKYCGLNVNQGLETGQGSGAEKDKASGGYKYHESALEALEYTSEEKLSDEESIHLSDYEVVARLIDPCNEQC